MSYQLTPKAVDDVFNIYVQGVLMFGQPQAERYHARLEDAFVLLSANPRMAHERTEIDPPIRLQPHSSHVNIYQITDNDDVLILAVRHARENWRDDL
jgi:toxin ParE1/3/4